MANTQSFPFFDTDLTKVFAEFKIPGFDMEALVSTQRRNIEAVTAANQLAIEGVQGVFRRQAEILRQLVEESAANLRELTAAGAPEQKIAQQTELVKTAFEKALGNLRELTEMVARSNTEAANVLTKRVGESLAELKDAVQKTKA